MKLPLRWRLALTAGATALLLGILLRHLGGAAEFSRAVRGARAAWVTAAFGAAVGCVALGAWRWSMVLAAMGCKLEYRRSLGALLAVWPLAVVTPSRANELLRPLLVRDRIPLAAGAGSVIAEKAIDLFVLVLLAASGMTVRREWAAAAILAAAGAGEASLAVVVLTRWHWLASLPVLARRRNVVEDVVLASVALRKSPGRLFGVAAVSLVVRALTVAVTQCLLVAVGARTDLFQTATLWPAAMLVGLAPLTLAGMGTRDAAFIYLLGARGIPVDRAAVLAATVGYSAIAIWSFAVLGLPFLLRALLREDWRLPTA